MFNSGFWWNAVGPCSNSLLAPHFISQPSPLSNAVHYLQRAFTRRTSGHCLGIFIAVNLSVFPFKFSFIICTHPQISLGKSSQGEWGGRGM
jgi:hypothetical protein